ncbi:hypothetical protein BD410DRAFT_560764 [Rickenella mellea]|uniref:LysM domain-containing protein n=1 Tax=Rickenella mellea TaxID=50990 RepID=A0A4Y7QF66_9AGAM|nr:hypothetical protein BD410DRAFT_560764 [Rickenella mellea]
MFSNLALVAVVVAPFLGTAAAQGTCARNYTVALGDFCDGISAKESVSTFQLAHVNSAKIDPACDNLALGEPLCLGIVGQDCSATHVVASGDSCPVIAQNANIPTSTLLANNPNVFANCTNIYPGEVLCIDSKIFKYT